MKIIFIIILFQINISLFNKPVYAQTSNEINLMSSIFDVDEHKPKYNYTKKNKNEIQLLFSGLFLFYKNFLSSQDGASCTFTPSCSEYAIQSIKKHGIFIGIPQTFDRLTRCNGLSPERYSIDPKIGLLQDNVE